MSYTTVYRVPINGELLTIEELKNSWGSGPRVWNAICDKYIIIPGMSELDACVLRQSSIYGSFSNDKTASKAFWALADDPKLSLAEQLVFKSTFDDVIIDRAHLKEMAEHFRAFDKMFPVDGVVNHLESFARICEEESDIKDSAGICFCLTSVCGDAWHVSAGDDYRLFDLSKDHPTYGSWFMFEEKE